ncbi:hypothetical protein [Streptomyces sp. N35]|uniref:hypothetical protein n=1 Tax=Streptomyces sp. N35 TaxID=2795730 RepID=UPI0018F43A54|nr:hypothetical protein [Streptomyces sp. N35]
MTGQGSLAAFADAVNAPSLHTLDLLAMPEPASLEEALALRHRVMEARRQALADFELAWGLAEAAAYRQVARHMPAETTTTAAPDPGIDGKDTNPAFTPHSTLLGGQS